LSVLLCSDKLDTRWLLVNVRVVFACTFSIKCLFAEVEGIYLLTSGVPDQPAEVCNSYLEEASAGRNIKLHVTLFSIDEADIAMMNGEGDEPSMLPCRYASVSQTAQVLRDMAHSTACGRFHWVRETGKLVYNTIVLCCCWQRIVSQYKVFKGKSTST